jgi:uncharacterized membrane protein YgdD (TMEM256/DUF423 family)
MRDRAMHEERRTRGVFRLRQGLAACGALACALAVGLAAYASHGVEGDARARLSLAAAFAFAHGLALATLAPRCERRLGIAAACMLFAGMLLFAGSLAGAALWQWPTTFAPFGGTLLIAGWCAMAIDLARR